MISISVKINKGQLYLLDHMAKRLGMNRSELLRQIISDTIREIDSPKPKVSKSPENAAGKMDICTVAEIRKWADEDVKHEIWKLQRKVNAYNHEMAQIHRGRSSRLNIVWLNLFVCNTCNYITHIVTYAKRHRDRCDVYDAVCPHCNARFRTSSIRRRHCNSGKCVCTSYSGIIDKMNNGRRRRWT